MNTVGCTHFFTALLRLFWPEEGGHNLAEAGVAMKLPGRDGRDMVKFRLGAFISVAFALILEPCLELKINRGEDSEIGRLSVIPFRCNTWCACLPPKSGRRVSDEAAIHVMVGNKGASGLKPCLHCWNCVNPNADARGAVDGKSCAVYCTEPDFELFQQFSQSGLLNIASTLEKAHNAGMASCHPLAFATRRMFISSTIT